MPTLSRTLEGLVGRRIVRTLRAMKLWVRQRLGLAFYHPVQVRRRAELHGDPDYGGWCICPDGIDARSVVYDCGVGTDISFAVSLVRKYGLHVWAFDPTPKSIQWFARQPHPPEVVLYPYGIADIDREATLHLPDNPAHGSGTLVASVAHRARSVQVEVRRVATIMAILGHAKVDILKLDIEGAEYGVLTDVLRCDLAVEQILVEFHDIHGSPKFAPARRVIEELNHHGYRTFAVKHGTDFSLIRASESPK